MKKWTILICSLLLICIACGGTPDQLDREKLKRNADEAQRELK